MRFSKVFFVSLLLLSTACTSECTRTSKVKTLGQCASDGFWGNTSAHCVALTEDGTRVEQDSPMIVGQEVCVEK